MLKSLVLLAMIQTGIIKADYPNCEDVYKTALLFHADAGRTLVGKQEIVNGVILFFGTVPNAEMYALAFIEEGSLTLVGSDLFSHKGVCKIKKDSFSYFTAAIPGDK